MAVIFIIEDDKTIAELMNRCLSMTGHHCLTASSGSEALSIFKEQNPDLILLDINLPDVDGFTLAAQLPDPKPPVIYVTARSDISDRVRGLNGGAEDYIVKPFDFQELIARVNVVLRRYHKEESLFQCNGITVHLDDYKAYRGDREIPMTKQEFELLRALILNKNLTLTRDQLLNAAWGWDYDGDARTVDVHILRLRKKLHWENYIKTVYKIGYRLEV